VDADELYRLPPEQFTAARDALAKRLRRDGDREGAADVAALRRPSVAAWLVNRLAEQSPDLLTQLVDLGPELARAQTGSDAAALRELGAQRHALVEAVSGTAVEAGGRPVSAAVREEVHATLDAALADPASAAAVRSGRLVRALSYAGFGEVDLVGAVAPGRPAPALGDVAATSGRRDQRREREAAALAAAVAAAADTAGRLDDAVRACERAEARRVRAAEAAQERRIEVERRTEELARARAEHDRAREQEQTSADAAAAALEAVRTAQDEAERARAALDRLRRGAAELSGR